MELTKMAADVWLSRNRNQPALAEYLYNYTPGQDPNGIEMIDADGNRVIVRRGQTGGYRPPGFNPAGPPPQNVYVDVIGEPLGLPIGPASFVPPPAGGLEYTRPVPSSAAEEFPWLGLAAAAAVFLLLYKRS